MITQAPRQLKDDLYEQFARICKALGNAHRFELLSILSQGEHSVDQLARETHMTTANTSQHLQHLRSSRLVLIRRAGVEIYYRLSAPMVFNLVQAVQDLAQVRLAEVDRIVDELILSRSDLKVKSIDELEEELDNPQLVILDVRPQSEYKTDHITGAVSIPLDNLEQTYTQLEKDKTIVVYCRDYYSRLSDEAARFLQTKDYDVYRLEYGFSRWKFLGKTTESFAS
ncbi:MAG: metalloregulator ArsR/SmtB family transcription factor [Anaerolineaceae bacterium]|nr:metalloregulator ArsR/SmtB family transcription factor [Anaerolineaceae bacterium]